MLPLPHPMAAPPNGLEQSCVAVGCFSDQSWGRSNRYPRTMEDPATSLESRRSPRRDRRGEREDYIRFGSGTDGLARAEVRLSSCAFSPHRHDSYAIGITLSGVQRFEYRRSRHVCLPGQLHVLYPDEVHDGSAGTDSGFAYRIMYIAPELLTEACGSRTLPFVGNPVHNQGRVSTLVRWLLGSLDDPIGELACADIAATLVESLSALSGRSADSQPGPIHMQGVRVAREYLLANAREQTSAATLEELTGTDRYTLARHFRRAYGTSPDRYRTLRRLELARERMEAGVSLAEVAAWAGFADQSHFTRQFKKAFGMPPGRWLTLRSDAG